MEDGRTNVNDFSIGIELVNKNDGIDPFPETQIQALRDLMKSIMTRHPIQHIIPHYACADPPAENPIRTASMNRGSRPEVKSGGGPVLQRHS